MKSIFVVFLAFAVAYPAHGFLLDTISSISNSISNTVDSISSAVNTAQFLGTFLWDNAFGPAWEQFLAGGADFIDNYFGNLLNGKRDAERKFQLAAIQALFQVDGAEIINNFKALFLQFIQDAQTVVLSSLVGLVFGTTTINDIMGQLLVKVQALIAEAVQYGTQVLSSITEMFGVEFSGLAAGLQSQLVLLGNQFQTEINAVTAGVINAVNGALSVFFNEFSELYDYVMGQYQAFMTEFNKIIASSLIGLLFGITNVNAIFEKIIATAQAYVMETIQYSFQYVVANAQNFYVAFQPYLNEAVTVVMQQLATVVPQISGLGPVITNLLTSIITP